MIFFVGAYCVRPFYFSENTYSWEQRKLGEIVHFYSGLTYSPNNVVENGTLVLRSSNVQENQIVTDDSVFVDPNVVNSDNVQLGDIIVVVRNGSKNLIGKHARIQSVMSNTVIGAFMTGIRSPNPEFLSALLDTQKFNDEIDKNLGATINQITTGNFKQMEFSFPSEEEQTAIGNFFKQLDETIALHQRQTEKYQKLKQGFLQSIFQTEKHQISLKNTNAWEQRKLGEISTFLNGRAYKQEELLDKGKYPVLRVGNFNTNSQWYYSDLELDEKFYAHNGDLLYTWATLFAPYIWKGKTVIYHYHIWKIELSENFGKVFMLYCLEANSKKILNNTNGSTMIHITKEEIENKKLSFPTLPEQTAIGNFFKQLDETIALHQRQIEKYRLIKKLFLEKMFIK